MHLDGELGRQPRLAHSGLARDQHHPAGTRQHASRQCSRNQARSASRPPSSVPASSSGGSSAGSGAATGSDGSCARMARSRSTQPLARLDPQLLDQRPARVLVSLQRVGPPVAAIHAGSAARAGPRVWELADQRLELPPHLRAGRARAWPRSAARAPPRAGLRAGRSPPGQTARRRARPAARPATTKAPARTPRPRAPGDSPARCARRRRAARTGAIQAFRVDLSSWPRSRVTTSSADADPSLPASALRSRETRACSALAALAGGRSPHSSSISRSVLSVSLGCSNNNPSSAALLAPPERHRPAIIKNLRTPG